MPSDYDYFMKYIIIGDEGVGKSCLRSQFTDKRFQSYPIAVGVDFTMMFVDVEGKKIELLIYDIVGIVHIAKLFYHGSVGVLLVYDITSRETFDNLLIWLEDARQNINPNATIILIGNKNDLESRRVVSYTEGEAFAQQYGLFFMETSAKVEDNFDKSFIIHTTKDIYEKINQGIIVVGDKERRKWDEERKSSTSTLSTFQLPNFSKFFTKYLPKYDNNIAEFSVNDTITEGGLSSQIWIKNSIKGKLIKYMEWNELTDKSQVGSGHFGSVFKAYWTKTNNYVVCKKLNNISNIQNQIWDALQHEIQMQIRAHACENIIRFLGVTQDPLNDNYCIVMEYADDGDLRIYLEKHFLSFDWDKKYQLAFDITNGIHYLHKENILHRDLHAKNIVIQKGKAKITDFGAAKGVETQTNLHKETFGMAPYVAPELFVYDNSQPPLFSMKTDIYSLGILLWELSSGYPPFKNQFGMGLIFNIINGTREQKIPNTPLAYYDLYVSCWDGNPEKRPIVEDIYDRLKNMLSKNNEMTKDKKVDVEDIEDEYSKSIVINFLDKK